MPEVALAFLWHQHQPYYPDDLAGENPMPWVRLHGVKDYYGMAAHLLERPEMRCTINLVPSLLVQLEAYTERGASDRPLQVSRLPASGLGEADALYLLDHFFMAHHEQMIHPLPRYRDLLHRRALGKNTAREALRRFNERDLRDLQVLFNLAWVHPLAVERDPALQDLRAKGRHYTEGDKQALLDKHIEILRQIIPLHRQLAERGQVELTTTPFYHPILPLLLDKKLGREAMPNVKLPHYTGGYPEDAAVHVQRAVTHHAAVFGKPPRGMWPAEGSVCQSMIPLLAQHDIRWIATDEGVLGQSTQGFVGRDAQGHARNPSHLYRPYRVREAEHELGIVFRDHALSDMIGFQYKRSRGDEAARDFVHHLHEIRKSVPADEPALVAVILDGENCWEHYPEGGVPFLRELYRLCTTDPAIRPVSIGDYLEANPPRDTLPHLFAGSWINHNFAIWVGHEEDNTAWDALHRAREHLRHRAAQPHLPPDKLRQAWDELYIAEGSDWFWWYGDDHSSAQDALFDYLFRKHLQNIYVLLGDAPPLDLSRPIKRKARRPIHTLPRSFLQVNVDGRETYFEWINAGRYTCQAERGTMAMVTRGPLKDVYFGFDLEHLFIRADFDQPARGALAGFEALRLDFVEPADCELRIEQPGRRGQRTAWVCRGETADAADIAFAIDRIVEVAIPFDKLSVRIGEPVQFFVELTEGRQSRDRAPREGVISLTRPSADFERVMWDV
jgi:alpha-amylase/alpha-mannosidase (GH57 family)